MKNLLNISDLNQNDFEKILQFAEDLDSKTEQTLTNKNIGLIFEKNSTNMLQEAGANFLQTQIVMDRNCLINFCQEISNPLEIPVIAGVFLLKSYKNALFINKFVPGANIPENILNRLKEAKDPLKEGILIASEQAKDFINIADGIHIMAVKAENLIPEILEKAGLNLEY